MPKVAALITASGGIGSHYVLHKLQGHPSIATLKESAFRSQGGTSKGDLKRFLSQKVLPDLHPEQLHPKKNILESDWIILNKPPLKMINYHRTFHPDLPVLYIFRNPVSFYYTWLRKWKDYGDSRYAGRHLSDDQVYEWFKTTFMSSLYELAQNFDSKRDNIISFEHFFQHTDSELQRIYKCLDVEIVPNKDLVVMNTCTVCNTEMIERKKVPLRSGREEEVLYCPRHGLVLGPGEYNYIRKEDSSFLNKWKQNSDLETNCKKFEKLFGEELINYYVEEKYLADADRKEFDKLMHGFLNGLRI